MRALCSNTECNGTAHLPRYRFSPAPDLHHVSHSTICWWGRWIAVSLRHLQVKSLLWKRKDSQEESSPLSLPTAMMTMPTCSSNRVGDKSSSLQSFLKLVKVDIQGAGQMVMALVSHKVHVFSLFLPFNVLMLLRISSAIIMNVTGFTPASCTYLYLYLSVPLFSNLCIYTNYMLFHSSWT